MKKRVTIISISIVTITTILALWFFFAHQEAKNSLHDVVLSVDDYIKKEQFKNALGVALDTVHQVYFNEVNNTALQKDH